MSDGKKGIGIVGFGYWGPNLARNFAALDDCRLAAVCEIRPELAKRAAEYYPSAKVTGDYDELLMDDGVDAVVISTPVSTHYDLAMKALRAGKDVLAGKPLTRTSTEARELIDTASDHGRVLAVDHTFLYTPAVRKIKKIMDSGELGQIAYMDSVRVNLGMFQQDVNVIYDLAPHDISIACYLLDEDPYTVRAVGATYSGRDVEYLAYIHLEYSEGLTAHFHLNWLSPIKIRRTLIAGRNRMIVYDDMETSEKVKIYDRGITIADDDLDSLYKTYVDYRTGDMIAPKLDTTEALAAEAAHFAECMDTRRNPLTDGEAGLRVVRIIEAAQASIDRGGEKMELAR